MWSSATTFIAPSMVQQSRRQLQLRRSIGVAGMRGSADQVPGERLGEGVLQRRGLEAKLASGAAEIVARWRPGIRTIGAGGQGQVGERDGHQLRGLPESLADRLDEHL